MSESTPEQTVEPTAEHTTPSGAGLTGVARRAVVVGANRIPFARAHGAYAVPSTVLVTRLARP